MLDLIEVKNKITDKVEQWAIEIIKQRIEEGYDTGHMDKLLGLK